jgi:S-DNA-T family DNA segregation ATPase FtsK/SpoIIIE
MPSEDDARTKASTAHTSADSATPESDPPRTGWTKEEVAGLLFVVLGALMTLALVSHHSSGRNLIGPVGATLSGMLLFFAGIGAFLFAVVPIVMGVAMMRGRRLMLDAWRLAGALLIVLSLPALVTMSLDVSVLGHDPGGLVGALVTEMLRLAFGKTGAALLAVTLALVGIMLAADLSLVEVVSRVWRRARLLARRRFPRRADAAIHVPSEQGAAYAGAWAVASGSQASSVVEDGEGDEAPEPVAVASEPESTDGSEAPRGVRAMWRTALSRVRGSRKTRAAAEAAEQPPEYASYDAAGEPLDEPAWVSSLDDAGGALDVAPPARPAAPKARRVEAPPAPTVPEKPRRSAIPEARDDSAPAESPRAESLRAESPEQESAPTPSPRRDAAGAPVADDAAMHSPAGDDVDFGPRIVESEALKNRKRAEDLDRAHQGALALGGEGAQWQFPPVSFLRYEEAAGQSVDRERLHDLAAEVERVLADFKVTGKVTGILPGPVVTCFEFEPDRGTKLSRISGLSDDIAMALRAHKVRIIAPIPGKGCVGIEVPNENRESVYLKEIICDEAFTRSKSKLTLALGKDTEGYPVVMDLAKCPHLLVAGTTGSGKSVSVNTMITSILYNATPDEVKLILIDPKQLEFAIYQKVPHLLLPVVTDTAKAATALNWAVQEMERRYSLMSDLVVRGIASYNTKLKRILSERADRLASDPSRPPSPLEMKLEQTDDAGRMLHRPMYQLVVIVDEYADLIMATGKEVELAVARLAQKARAAGIHVVLATQRPSVDVITGLIKSNFPTRLSFRLMSGTDSRTVLDQIGAENLLGMGDMLYRPPGESALQRVHGAYVDEAEIEQIVDFLHDQREPEFDESILTATAAPDSSDEDGPVDELYDQAVAVVYQEGYASISMLQRHLSIGYNRSAKIVEEMERQGIIGPRSGGSSRREVLGGGSNFASYT